MLKSYSLLIVSVLVSLLAPAAVLSQDLSFVFTDSLSEVEVSVGSSAVKEVSVKNIGDFESIVELSVETTAPVSVGVVPGSLSISRSATGAFSLSFLSSPTNVVNRYPSKLRLRGNNGVDVSKDFSIVILPTADKKIEINANYLSTLNKFENLQKRFDQVKDSGCVLVSPGDVQAVTPKQIVSSLQDLKDVLEKTRIAIKESDFVTANVEVEKSGQLAAVVESEINSLRGLQESCEEDKARVSGYVAGGVLTTTVGIIVIVVIVGLLVYRHYTRLPKVRKLLPSGQVKIHTPSEPAEKPAGPYHGLGRIEKRKGFNYEFKKKK